MNRPHQTIRLFAISTALSALLAGCASVGTDGGYVAPVVPLKGSKVAQTFTDYTPALRCMADVAGRQAYPAPRIAIGNITDMTGAEDFYLGRRLTQGATLMAITAVSNAGMRVIERYDTGVTQVDLDFANNRLLRDSPTVIRANKEGQIQGVDLYIVGGISEYNHNLQSRGKDASFAKSGDKGGSAFASSSDYVVDVGMDLRLIDARTTEVLAVRSYRKQVRGQERELGAALTATGSGLEIGMGGRKNEPIQMAIRSIIDRSVFEFTAGLYGGDAGNCLALAQQIESGPPRPTALAQRAMANGRYPYYQTAQAAPYAIAPPTVQPAPWLQQSYPSQGQYGAYPPMQMPQVPFVPSPTPNFGQPQQPAQIGGYGTDQYQQPTYPEARPNPATPQDPMRRGVK